MKVPATTLSSNRYTSVIWAICLGILTISGIPACHHSSNDPDPIVIYPELTVSLPTVTEGDSGTTMLMKFSVTLSKALAQDLTFDYSFVDESATLEGNDYIIEGSASGSKTILAGETTVDFIVYANGDDDFEPDETFSLELSNIQGATLDASSYSGQGIILNDEDADPKGYFTGTATLNGTEYSDMTALVYGNRILLFSPTANVQYDMAITPTLDAYTGTVEVYVDGVIEQVSTVIVSGTVSGTTNELQITGTFADGTGFADGSFDVAFDSSNNKGATLDRIFGSYNIFRGNVYGYDVDTGSFSVDKDSSYVGNDDEVERCAYSYPSKSYLEIPPEEVNIYKMSHIIENYGKGTCAAPYASRDHTGFAAVLDDGGTDNKLVYAFNNDSIAIFAVMTLP